MPKALMPKARLPKTLMRRMLPAVAVVVALLAGCTAAAPSDRALTTEEAQRLAIARFTNYDEGVREVVAEVPGQQPLRLTGWVDFVDHRGLVSVGTSEDAVGELGLYAWTGEMIAARDGGVTAAGLPLPQDGWQIEPLDPSSSVLQNLFVVALSLGSDRPDNPTLLQQSDARWLRADKIDGTVVDVISGPTSDGPATGTPDPTAATVRYWVDGDGRLLRVELRQPGGDEWTVLDLGDKADLDLSPVDALVAGRG